MTVAQLPNASFVLWPSVDGADCVEVSRTGSDPVRLGGSAVSYAWTDAPMEFDLTKTVVTPRLYAVTAYRGGRSCAGSVTSSTAR
jgi:hypothetical protein